MRNSFRLKNFPITFFSITLGISGLSLAWQKVGSILLPGTLGATISIAFFVLSSVVLFVTLFFYVMKMIFHFDLVVKEFLDPIKINFFPILAKIMLIFSIFLIGYQQVGYSKVFWIIGTLLQLVFSFVILSSWMHNDKFEIKHINPAIFMPIVGNLMIPIAGVAHVNSEILWFFFSVGLVLWLIFTTLVFYRIIFHDTLTEKLMPTFFILMAPPAIAFIAYVKLTGVVDSFAKILYNFSLFIFLLLLFQARHFLKLKFYLSSWAYSFPLAAFTIATFFMYHMQELTFFKNLSFFSLGLLNVIMIFLFVRTAKGIANKEICVGE